MKYKTFFQLKTLIFQLVALGFYVFFILSMLSFNPADQFNTNIWPNQEPMNWCGESGAWAAAVFYQFFGYGVYLMIYLGGFHLLRFFFGYHAKYYRLRFCGYVICQLAVCALITLLFCNNLDVPNPLYGDSGFSETYSTNLIYGHGGMVGVSWASFFLRGGPFLAYLSLFAMMGFGFFLYSDFVMPFILRRIAHTLSKKNLRRILPWVRWLLQPRTGWKRVFDEHLRLRPRFQKAVSWSSERVSANDVDGDLPTFSEDKNTSKTRKGKSDVKTNEKLEEAIEIADPDTTPPPEVSPTALAGRKPLKEMEIGRFENSGLNENLSKLEEERTISIHRPESVPVDLTEGNPLTKSAETEAGAEENVRMKEHQAEDEPEYVFPTLDLLSPADDVDYSEFEVEAQERAGLLERIVHEFGFKICVREIQLGPTITQYQVEPEQGLRVNKIASLADDLAVKLGVSNVRIVFPLLGKQNLIGIEIPNVKKQLVRLREVMEQLAGTYDRMSVPMFLGKDVAGKPLMADLAALPHLLIAGRTGTGKSVCLNSIITSIIMTRSPKDIRMLMIDPKMVEMSQYRTIPHLMHPVVTDMKKAEAILGWAVEKMEDRYRWLSRAGVRHIKDFNKMPHETKLKRVKPKAGETMPETMPFIVIVVDEMADLMMTAPKDVESHIIRLAQKSRAVGIHLILATQKPIVTVITSLIKSNLPARIAFQVSSKTDSRVVLDENGADRLLGNGDMLFLQPGTSILVRAQGTYLSDDEINRVVDSISTEEPQFEGEIEQHLSGGGSGKLAEWAAKDELYTSAIEIIVNEGRGSISLLQRMLGIGYGRAARLIDFMEEDKIVGAFNGYTKPREVLLTKDVWRAMKAEFEQEQEQGIQAELARVEAEKAMARIGNTLEGDESDEDDEENFDEGDSEKEYFPDENSEENGDEDSDDYFLDSSEEDEDGVPWNEETVWDEETETPLFPLPSRPVERSRGKSRRRQTPNYEKIRRMSETDTVNSAESREVLSRIEPNQPKPFLMDEDDDFRKIN